MDADDRAAKAARARALLKRAQEKKQNAMAATSKSPTPSIPAVLVGGESSSMHSEHVHHNVDSSTSQESNNGVAEIDLNARLSSIQEETNAKLERLQHDYTAKLAAIQRQNSSEQQALQRRLTEMTEEHVHLKKQVHILQSEIENLRMSEIAQVRTERAANTASLPDLSEKSNGVQSGHQPEEQITEESQAGLLRAGRKNQSTSSNVTLSSKSPEANAMRYSPTPSSRLTQAPTVEADRAGASNIYFNPSSSAPTNLYQLAANEHQRSQDYIPEQAEPWHEGYGDEDVFKANDDDDVVFGESEELPAIEEEHEQQAIAATTSPITDSKRQSNANDIGDLFGPSTAFADSDPFGKIGRNDSHDFSAAFRDSVPSTRRDEVIATSQPTVKLDAIDTTDADNLFNKTLASPPSSRTVPQTTLNVAPLASPFSPAPSVRDNAATDSISPVSNRIGGIEEAFSSGIKPTTLAANGLGQQPTSAEVEREGDDVSDLFRNSSADLFGPKHSKPAQPPAAVPPPPRTPQRGGLPMMSFTAAPAPAEEKDEIAAGSMSNEALDSANTSDASILFGASPPKPIVGGSKARGSYHRRAITNANLDFLSSPMRPGVSYGGQPAAEEGADIHVVPAARKAQLLKMGKAAASARKPPTSVDDRGTEMSAASLFGG